MEKNQRALRIKAFLEKDCELAGYRLEDMVTDASVRRYFRVVRADGSTAVLMDDESPYTKIREFVKIDSLLRGIGVRAPEILAQKTEEGFLLLEDFGDKDFAAVLDGRNDAAVFKLAVDALLKIYKDARRPDYVKDMDDAFIVKDFRLFLDWYMPAVLGNGLSDRAATRVSGHYRRFAAAGRKSSVVAGVVGLSCQQRHAASEQQRMRRY